MKYEFTTDAEFITRCMTQPEVWRMGTDDNAASVNPKMFYVNPDGNLWLKCDDYGLLMCEPLMHDALKLHIGFTPNVKGRAIDVCKGAFRWLLTNTTTVRLLADIPTYNNLTIRLAIKSGMINVGTHCKSFKKDNVLYDQRLFKIARGDICLD